MISQFSKAKDDVEHIIVENNPDWIEFFKHNYSLPANSKIQLLDLDYVPLKEAESVRCYKDFSKTFEDLLTKLTN